MKCRKKFKVGVNFDSATRTIGDWKIVEEWKQKPLKHFQQKASMVQNSWKPVGFVLKFFRNPSGFHYLSLWLFMVIFDSIFAEDCLG